MPLAPPVTIATFPASLDILHASAADGTLSKCTRTPQGAAMANDIADRLAIREIVENWALWRDARRWDRFRRLWHPDGRMWATWFQGSFEDFIAVIQQGYDTGARIHHMLGGSSVDIAGERAVAGTKLSIAQRAPVDGVPCDVTCWGRAYDYLEKREGRWGIVLRRHI